MRAIGKLLVSGAFLLTGAPALAQDAMGEEIIVTGTRMQGYSDTGRVVPARPAPAMMLRRTADFAVQPVRFTGDTRDQDQRHKEIYAMLKGAIELAAWNGIELATGDYIVEPLTLANYTNVLLEEDDARDDAEGAAVLVKTRLEPGMDAKAALDRISRFLKAVPTVGRAEIASQGDLTLSVVAPDQYRGQIIALIANDAKAAAARFGPEYRVSVTGLDRPVEWMRAGLTEVSLYLPAAYTLVPAE